MSRPLPLRKRIPELPHDRLKVPSGLRDAFERMSGVGNQLDKTVEAYNRSVATLESRVLVSARRLRDLKAALEGVGIEAIEPVERTARALQAQLRQSPQRKVKPMFLGETLLKGLWNVGERRV